jgi:hypothetical protein
MGGWTVRQASIDVALKILAILLSFYPVLYSKLWIEKTNDLVDIETDISRNLKGLVAIEIATAVRKKSLAAVETAIWFFETQPRWERELDR